MKRSSILLMVLALAGCGANASAPKGPHDESSSLESQAPDDGAEIQEASRAIEAGEFARARALLEEVLQARPESGAAAYYLGVALENLGDISAAEQSYRNAMRSSPQLVEAAINLGALYIDAENFDEAISVTQASLANHPDDLALRVNLAMALEGRGESGEALRAYEKALELGQESAVLRWQYASLLLQVGEKDKARGELERALANAEDDRAVLATIGHSLRSAGAFASCVRAFDRAIDIEDAAELRLSRGLCRHSLDDEPGAKDDFESATRMAPENPAAHYYLGKSLLALRQKEAGIRALEEAARLAEDTPLATKAREEAQAARKKK